MTQINLIPWREVQRKKLKTQFLTLLAFAVILTLLLVVFIHFGFSYVLASRQARNAFLAAETNKVIAETGDLENEKKNGLQTVSALRFIINLQAENFQTVEGLNEITKHTPTAIVLTKIDKRHKFLLIEGTAVSNTDVTQFIKELSKSAVFKNPELTKIAASAQAGQTKKDFQIKVEQREFNEKP